MSVSTRNRSRKGGKTVKFPGGDIPPMVKSSDGSLPTTEDSKKAEEFVDEMMRSEWEPHLGRPHHDLFGFYAICRWYAKEASWVVLYVGRGHLHAMLEALFSSRHRTPLSQYLSSFPKASRNLIWFKWLKDPFYPCEGLSLEQVVSVVTARYNNQEKPAFQSEGPSHDEEALPDDFSIVPNWNKPARKKKSGTNEA